MDLISFSYSILTLFVLSVNADEVFDKFLLLTMSNYGAWLKANNLDPTTPTSAPIMLDYNAGNANITCILTNLKVSRHSNLMDPVPNLNRGDLIEQYFEVRYRGIGERTTYTAEYVLNGSFGVPVTGKGLWEMDLVVESSSIESYQYFMSYNFLINSQGFIELRKDTVKNQFYFLAKTILFLENLNADDMITELVKSGITLRFRQFLSKSSENNPFQNMLTQYLTEVFDKTPVSELL